MLIFLMISLIISSHTQLLAQSNAIEAAIPFTLNMQNNIVVQVLLNDSDKLKLMLHTAAREVTLTEEGAKKAKSIAFGGTNEVKSWEGSGTSRWSKGNTLQIGGLTQRNLTVHENKNSGEGTDGKFGLDFFGKQVVEIDFGCSVITVHDRVPAKGEGYTRLKMESREGEYFVPGVCLIDGKEYTTKFLLHSGYSGGLLLDDVFAKSSGVEGKIKITDESSLKDSFGHTIKIKKGMLPGFILGKTTISDVPIGFFSGGVGAQKMSVLGGDILKRFNLIFDLANNDLYLKAIRKAADPEKKFDATSIYQKEVIQGFNVLVNPAVLEHPEEAGRARKELEKQLQEIVRVVPAKPLAAIKGVTIWVEWEANPKGAAELHPSAGWLKSHGYNPEKAGCVEINNTRNLVAWSRIQPWMVFHELAHAYHHLVLGVNHSGIEAAYQQAVERKLYESVDYSNGGKRRAYALTNAKEYFAELSEAYFGRNDFYPFVRAELEKHDPVGFRLMKEVWRE